MELLVEHEEISHCSLPPKAVGAASRPAVDDGVWIVLTEDACDFGVAVHAEHVVEDEDAELLWKSHHVEIERGV